MRKIKHGFFSIGAGVGLLVLVGTGCQTTPTNTTVTNTNTVNSNINTNTNVSAGTTTITTSEPDRYQAAVKLTFELLGEGQKTTPPPLGAVVARSGQDRVMEFTLPTNEKVIYLDKGGMNYVILPGRKQYAELTKEALGFEVRRLMMPEQIVQQVKAIPGVRVVGEESVNGRTAVKYAYSGTASTQTQAGNVATESFVLVDKETGLPVRSETVSQTQTGANVQGFKGVRILTEMTDIKTAPDSNLFNLPTDFQKIDPEQVKAQATLIFNAIAALVGQAMQQAQPQPPATSPTASPVR